MSTQNQQAPAGSRTQRGFSLIELLIVVAVILIIAAIAIPNFIRSRMRANEASAVQNLKTITTANTVYLTTYGIGYSTDLAKLGGTLVVVDQNSAGLIDSVLASGVKSGYSYSYSVLASDTLGHAVSFCITAEPVTVGSTGENYFYTDQSSIVRHSTTGAATVTDPAI